MPRLAANLSFLFQEERAEDRIAAAARAGFKGVEILTPGMPSTWWTAELGRCGVELALFNAAIGDWGSNERGIGALPGEETRFDQDIEAAIRFAEAVGCRRIHVMAGLLPRGLDWDQALDTFADNLSHAAGKADSAGVALMVEPISPAAMPGYIVPDLETALAVLDRVDRKNVKFQFDFFHMQMTGGDITQRLEANLARIGHVQIAGAPGRNEPDRGELAHDRMLGLLDQLGYEGWVGCEYRPAAGTLEGLGWAEPWLHPT